MSSTVNAPSIALLDRLRDKTARTGVIGLGYVGLPLAMELARGGFDVTGIDVDGSKVETLNGGESYILDVASADVKDAVGGRRFRATTDFAALAELDTVNICVPTPLRKTKDPDLSYIVAAVDEIARYQRPGQLIILESTTYPGTTEEVVQAKLEEGGLRAGRDFYLAFSPERVDPGNPEYQTRNIPKVVGGVDAGSTLAAATLYQQIGLQTVPVSSSRVAEMVKLLENTFRAVNIGLVNELAMMCHDLNVDVWEVIEAARTKPFGFMPFYPGPGLGGHCIPIDPFYLSWKARQNGFESRFIELAGQVNSFMPRFVVDRVTEALNSVGKAVRGSRIHLFGMAYKPDVGDARESPAIDIAQLLQRRGATVTYSDPHVPFVAHGDFQMEAVSGEEALASAPDCVVITTNHKVFDYAAIARAPMVVDTRNALKDVRGQHIFTL
jgi:UDP-N-acetyl-D-glucosamine dehydrogenase